MSEQIPEFDKLVGSGRETGEIFHEEKSITGSAQAIGLEPSENFIAPTMALDSIEPEPET